MRQGIIMLLALAFVGCAKPPTCKVGNKMPSEYKGFIVLSQETGEIWGYETHRHGTYLIATFNDTIIYIKNTNWDTKK